MKWKFWEKQWPEHEIEYPEQAEKSAFAERMIAMGYKLWTYDPPRDTQEIEICAYRFEKPSVIRKSDLHPEWNIAGVWWRPVGSMTIDANAAD